MRISLINLNYYIMKIRLLLFIFSFVLLSHSLYSQQHTRGVLFTSERNNKGEIIIVAENRDFCDYFVKIEFRDLMDYTVRGNITKGETVSRGKKIIATLTKSNPNSRGTYNYSTRIYKGSLDSKVNPDFIYTLPVKDGDSIQSLPAKGSRFTTIFNLQQVGDTIYACRGGQVCDKDLTDTETRSASQKNSITIYHNDGSLGEYTNYSKELVSVGDNVKIGQPIAIVKPNEKGQKRVRFSVYFLDKNRVENNETGLKHSSLVPVFHSANNRDGKLENKTTYIAQITEELLMQDMSKKELKKYLKNKEKEADKK